MLNGKEYTTERADNPVYEKKEVEVSAKAKRQVFNNAGIEIVDSARVVPFVGPMRETIMKREVKNK